eukprot:156227-Alexandrium_andersonii.AAC.1
MPISRPRWYRHRSLVLEVQSAKAQVPPQLHPRKCVSVPGKKGSSLRGSEIHGSTEQHELDQGSGVRVFRHGCGH